MFKEFFEQDVLTIGSNIISLGQILTAVGLLLLLFILWHLSLKRILPLLFQKNQVAENSQKSLKRKLFFLIIIIILIILVWSIGADYFITIGTYGQISILLGLFALFIFQLARLIDWLISNIFVHQYYIRRDQSIKSKTRSVNPESSANRTVTTMVYLLAGIVILRALNLDFSLFTYVNDSNVIPFRISKIFQALVILVSARLLVWLIVHIFLYNYYKQQKVNQGSQYAFNKLISYVIYVVAIIIALQNLGINMTLIIGGAAALLVGVGLGLQQTFNDFFSGIVLLFERSVELGDVLVVDSQIGTVKKIGLRSSILETIENVTLVVPNSKIVTQNVINWSHQDNKVLFKVEVGVAYGTDIEKVKLILSEVANNHEQVLNNPPPFVRFVNFGDSALVFQLLFYSKNLKIIPNIKSDLRFEIYRSFRENNIIIPFPQRDVWLKKED